MFRFAQFLLIGLVAGCPSPTPSPDVDLAAAADLTATPDLAIGGPDFAGVDLNTVGCAPTFGGCTTYVDARTNATLRQITALATSNTFDPPCLRIRVGQTISFSNNVPIHFLTGASSDPDRALDPPSNQSTLTRTFTSVGVYGFYCSSHGNNTGGGMAGAIYVEP